jgi:hypothetical protein
MSIDYEEIYRLAYQERWADLLDLVHKNAKEASSDDMVQQAVKTFENYFFSQLEIGITENTEPYLQTLFSLHIGKIYELPQDRFNRVVVILVETYEKAGEHYAAYDCAKFYPQHELCAKVINEHEASLPKIVEHSQRDQIRVVESAVVSEEDHTISLFRSQQEIDFFMALRDAFQMFTVYPNVALSCIIDYEQIKSNLSQVERDFFFRGIVDCVVFDHYNNYKPLHCFELDSGFHDAEQQKQKDDYKTRILSLAGKTLYRIRKTARKQGQKEFARLIRDVFKRNAV